MSEAKRLVLEPAVYEALWTYSNDLVSIVRADGSLRYASPSYRRTVGYESDELVDTSIFTRIHPDDVERVRATFVRLRDDGGVATAVFRYRHKDGSWRMIEATGANHLNDPVVQGFLINGRDITERLEAEERVRTRSLELLEQRVEERTEELTTLLDVSRTVASTLELEPLLSLVLDALQRLVGYDGASISVVDGDDLVIVVGRPGFDAPRPATRRMPADERSPIWHLVAGEGPLIIDDVRGQSPLAVLYREAAAEAGYAELDGFRSWMGVPLPLKERVVGVLALIHREPGAFSAHQADLVAGVCQQVAIAIENVHLYERAQEAAVLKERQRLSRELHDSVSQVLYSVALGSRTASALVDADPAGAHDAINFTLAQAERGLAEMRALIFELRPESLEQEGLVAALERQIAALRARHQIPIHLATGDEPLASVAVKEAMYRIAQEALHNIFKHAAASEVAVTLNSVDAHLVLEIQDNGNGFDPGASFPGHLGLQSMRERAARLHGTVEIRSGKGNGTTVRACLPGQDRVSGADRG